VQSAQAPDHHEVLTSCQHLVEGRVLSGDTDVAPDLGRLGDDVEAGDARTTPSGMASVVRMRTAVSFLHRSAEHARIAPAGTSRSIPARATVRPKRFLRPRLDHESVGMGLRQSFSEVTNLPHGK